jgi:hypothetical protein
MKVTAETLNSVMEFDHVIQVHSDGSVTEPVGIRAPEVYVDLDEDGQIIGVVSDSRDGVDVLSMPADWHFMHGYTGQHNSSSHSFIMHNSEYVGGKMARDILDQPGFYVAVAVKGLGLNVGWAVAYRQQA